jgi:hypothetical protein
MVKRKNSIRLLRTYISVSGQQLVEHTIGLHVALDNLDECLDTLRRISQLRTHHHISSGKRVVLASSCQYQVQITTVIMSHTSSLILSTSSQFK